MFESVAFREPRKVQPVPPPALPVSGSGEELIDDPLVGLRIIVPHEGLDLGWRRRQSDEVEIDAADELSAPERRGSNKSLLAMSRREKAVDC